MPGRARDDQHRRRRQQCPARRDQFRDRTARPVRTVEPQRHTRRDAEQRKAQLEIDHRPPNAVTRYSGTSAVISKTERSESFAVEASRYTGIAIRPSTADTPNATDTALSLTPSTVRITARATSNRITNRPIAAITNTNIAQRVISNCGVVAVAEIFGIRNSAPVPDSVRPRR